MDDISDQRIKKAIRNFLSVRVGKDKAIPSQSLAGFLRESGFRSTRDLRRKTRAAIRELRREGVPICSKAGRGYYMAKDLEEVLETAEDLDHTARDMHYTAKMIREAGRRQFGDQKKLF